MIENELFDESGNIPVWGNKSASGKPFYTFKLTEEDSYVLFPFTSDNPKAPKFHLKKSYPKEGV